MLAHVELGYGHGVAVGEREEEGQRVETVWTTDLQGDTLISTAPIDPQTREVSPESLRLELTKIIDIEGAT